MADHAEVVLRWLLSLPEALVYCLLGLVAALENIVPPIPADVIVLLGGVIAGSGGIDPGWAFLVVWGGNVASALLMYGLGRRYGAAFFRGRLGHTLLPPLQAAALTRAYRTRGMPILFFSRFLPVFRPVVPVFAGVARLGLGRVAPPIALASGLWYGLLVYLGTIAGANWHLLLDRIDRVGGWLWAITALLLALLARWWWHLRKAARNPEESE